MCDAMYDDIFRCHGGARLYWAAMRGYTLSLSALFSSVLFCFLTAGCKTKEPVPLAVRVTRITVGPGSGADPDDRNVRALASELREAAKRGLLRAGVPVAEDAADPHVGDFQLRMQVQLDGKPNGRALRMLCAGLLSARRPEQAGQREPDLTKLEHVGVAEQPLPANADVAALAAAGATLARRLVEDTARTLGEQAMLLGNESRALIALAGKQEGDPELRKTAMQILGQRKERLAVSVLISIVKERDLGDTSEAGDAGQRESRAAKRLLRDTAIGALVAIGDESAVRPLLDSVAFRDHGEMGKLVEAVAALGGDEARRYLQFVRGSHPDAIIRAEADSALRRLEQRRSAQDGGAGGKESL